jgi:hypothetical protein
LHLKIAKSANTTSDHTKKSFTFQNGHKNPDFYADFKFVEVVLKALIRNRKVLDKSLKFAYNFFEIHIKLF